MPITITSEINPILHVTEHYHPNTQCRIELISEVIVIGIYSDQHRQSYMPLFQSLFSQSYPLIFSQNVFALVSITFFTIKNVDEVS